MNKSRFEEGLDKFEQLAGKPGNLLEAYGKLGDLAIEELIIQTSVYAGFPTALNARKAMQEVREKIVEETP